MSSKKKLTISLCSLVFVCMAAIIGIVAVLAAKQTTVKNQFTISYNALNVKATISATYKKGTADPVALTVGEDSTKTKIKFNGNEDTNTESQHTQSFKPLNEITLNEGEELVFVYTITNDDSEGGDSFKVKVSGKDATDEDPDTADDNLTYTYSVTGVDATNPTWESLCTIAPQQTATITITIAIEDRDLDVKFTNSGLKFVLESVNA